MVNSSAIEAAAIEACKVLKQDSDLLQQAKAALAAQAAASTPHECEAAQQNFDVMFSRLRKAVFANSGADLSKLAAPHLFS